MVTSAKKNKTETRGRLLLYIGLENFSCNFHEQGLEAMSTERTGSESNVKCKGPKANKQVYSNHNMVAGGKGMKGTSKLEEVSSWRI